ncbi:putative RNA-directed DNA polymerase from transposon BS [Trichonephila clavipes]|nr:putative RNA-directed DNA polymerase from transposon BS [Trichonephila clavipes]
MIIKLFVRLLYIKDTLHPLFRDPFSLPELELAIGDSNLSKSPGPNGIYGQMITYLGEQAKLRLLDIINLSWSGGRLPRNWKKATIFPIQKPDKKSTSPESYRPITLTRIPCKIIYGKNDSHQTYFSSHF